MLLCVPLSLTAEPLQSWFRSMTLSEACRSAADTVLLPQRLQQFTACLQKLPPLHPPSDTAAGCEVRAWGGSTVSPPPPSSTQPFPLQDDASEQALTEEDVAAAVDAWNRGAAALPKPWKPPKPV